MDTPCSGGGSHTVSSVSLSVGVCSYTTSLARMKLVHPWQQVAGSTREDSTHDASQQPTWWQGVLWGRQRKMHASCNLTHIGERW